MTARKRIGLAFIIVGIIGFVYGVFAKFKSIEVNPSFIFSTFMLISGVFLLMKKANSNSKI